MYNEFLHLPYSLLRFFRYLTRIFFVFIAFSVLYTLLSVLSSILIFLPFFSTKFSTAPRFHCSFLHVSQLLVFFLLSLLFHNFFVSFFIQKVLTFSWSFPVFRAIVNNDPVVWSYDEFNALDTLLSNELTTSAVNMQPSGLIH